MCLFCIMLFISVLCFCIGKSTLLGCKKNSLGQSPRLLIVRASKISIGRQND